MKYAVIFFVLQFFCLMEFSHQRYVSIEDTEGPYRKPIPLMLHMDHIETPSFPLPNDVVQSGMQDTEQGGMQVSQDGTQDTVQGGIQDTQNGMQDTQDGMQDMQDGMQRDTRSQWDFQRDMSMNEMLRNLELQGGMQDTRAKRLHLPGKYGRPALPPSPKRKHIRWYQTRK